MAYFANGTEGEVFDEQCIRCKYGDRCCPIAAVQSMYNYDAVNNLVATEILSNLILDDGTCIMYEQFKTDFAIDPDQLKLNF